MGSALSAEGKTLLKSDREIASCKGTHKLQSMKKLPVLGIAVLMLAGCAKYVWVKPGGTQGEFSQDRYACMQETQQRVSGTIVTQYGGTSVGVSQNSVATNASLFQACMNARGWFLQAETGGIVGRELQETSTGQDQLLGRAGQVTSVDNSEIRIRDYSGVYHTYDVRDINVSDIKVGDRVLVTCPLGNRRPKSVDRF